MPKKRKVPVVRAWRFYSALGRVYLLQAGNRYYWRFEGRGWRIHYKKYHAAAVACGDYEPLPKSEARRLNNQRLKAMKGRKP